jgi:hypothetical protein
MGNKKSLQILVGKPEWNTHEGMDWGQLAQDNVYDSLLWSGLKLLESIENDNFSSKWEIFRFRIQMYVSVQWSGAEA